jgi:hypothetical protein
MNLGKLLKGAAKFVKANPEIALVVAGAIAPKLVAKGVRIAAKVKAAKELT